MSRAAELGAGFPRAKGPGRLATSRRFMYVGYAYYMYLIDGVVVRSLVKYDSHARFESLNGRFFFATCFLRALLVYIEILLCIEMTYTVF